jgi:N-acetyl sugar amidotransferase
MDTSDPSIIFDEEGVCIHCNNFSNNIVPNWHPDTKGEKQLQQIAAKIKREGKGKNFDCILGVSGGLDSSYAAYVTKEILGLRPLLLHVDAGWNTVQAVSNIEKLVDGLGLDLYTEVIDWEEMKDLQVAFLKSQIPDQDLPQDAAFFSSLYKFARKHKIKYVLTGANYSTECCHEPEAWGTYPGIDRTLFVDIHKKFGEERLDSFPLTDVMVYRLYYRYIFGMQVIKPLNFLPFVKKEAEALLHKRYGWEKYLHKHHDSRFTRFYEAYWLPRKFGYDRRRAHFSSLIMTGQMSRDDVLQRVSKPDFDEHFFSQEFEYVANKLGLTVEDLKVIFEGSNKTYRDYKNKMRLISLGAKVLRVMGLERRIFQ